MNDLDGMTKDEALSEVIRLRRDQDKLIGMIGSLPAKDLLRAVKLIRENSKRIRLIEDRHRPPAIILYDDQAAEDPELTNFERAIEGELDVLKESIRLLEEALDKIDDEPRLCTRLAEERNRMSDCLQNAIQVSTRISIIEVRCSEQQ